MSARCSRRAVIASASLLFGSAAHPAWAASHLVVATVPTEVSAQAYDALERGLFRARGLDVEILTMQNGAAASAGAAAGSMDIFHADTLSMVIAHSRGVSFTMLFGANVNTAATPTNGLLTVRKDSRITTGRDLTGRTIGVASLSNTNIFALRNWLDMHGGDSRAVHYVELPLPTMADAVASGRVDAASMDSANLESRSDLRELAATYVDIAPKFLAGGWFATPQWIERHRSESRAFVAALQAASVWANAHHDEAAAVYARSSRFSVQDLLRSARPLFYTEEDGNLAPLIQPVVDLAAKYGAIQQSFSATVLTSEAAANSTG